MRSVVARSEAQRGDLSRPFPYGRGKRADPADWPFRDACYGMGAGSGRGIECPSLSCLRGCRPVEGSASGEIGTLTVFPGASPDECGARLCNLVSFVDDQL